MPAQSISAHIREVLRQIDEVQPLPPDQRTRATYELYRVLKLVQAGHGNSIFPPLYPDTDRATPIFEKYRKSLNAQDILDDPPGPFMFEL
jgi:hypothetical protein